MIENSNNNNHNSSHNVVSCSNRRLRVKLPDYLLDRLSVDAAFEVEEHLAECTLCKDNYLMILSARGAAILKHEEVEADEGEVQPDEPVAVPN